MSQNYNYPSSPLSIGAQGTNGATAPTVSLEVAGINNTGKLTPLAIDASGNLKVAASSLPLPTGAATEATLLQVDADIVAMSAKLPATLGAHLISASLAVNIASDQIVPISASALPLPTGAATEATLAAISAQLPAALGAQVTAASVAVNIASDQTVPISAAALPLPSGASTEATLATMQAAVSARLAGSLVPAAFDEVDLTYVPSGAGAGQIATAVYKLASATIKTLTMSYDGSDRLSSVIAS